MKLTVKQELEILIRLQEMETRAQELRKTIDNVVACQGELEEVLDRERLILEEKEDALQKLKKNYASFEDDLEQNEDRLKKSEQTLRAVTNNRDYQVLLREMDDNRKVNSKIQETMLELLDQIGHMEAAVLEVQGKVNAEADRVEEQKAVLLASCSRERAALEDLEGERKSLGANASPRLVQFFEQAVQLGNGVGVSPVVGNLCRGCFMSLPPQFCIELQRYNALNRCPRCNRFVYWDGA